LIHTRAVFLDEASHHIQMAILGSEKQGRTSIVHWKIAIRNELRQIPQHS
jgi:hypothetical protein